LLIFVVTSFGGPQVNLMFFKILPNFKWPIVNYGLFKRLLELSSIYVKKFLESLSTLRKVCIQTLWHMFNLCADVLEIVWTSRLV
jgi:hypothetical protein